MKHVGTIWVCPRCGTERRRKVVPVDLANELEEVIDNLSSYIEATAGRESVLINVNILNAIAERAERAEKALRILQEKAGHLM